MKKSNIFRPSHNERVSFKIGWAGRSVVAKTMSIVLLLTWISATLWFAQTQQNNVAIIFVVSGISMFISYFTNTVKAEDTANSLLEVLHVHDGRLFIAGEAIAEYVSKVVLAKDEDSGTAFLQLAWNSGDEWRFNIDEYDAVAEYLTLNMPQLTLVKE